MEALKVENINWEPLEKTVGYDRCKNYLYKGQTLSYQTVIYVYQHVANGRYLYISQEGDLYYYSAAEHTYGLLSTEESHLLLEEFASFDQSFLH